MPRVELGSKKKTIETSTYLVHLVSHKALKMNKFLLYQSNIVLLKKLRHIF